MLDSFLSYSSILFVAIPAAGALILVLTPNNSRAINPIAQFVSLVTMILAVLAFIFFDPENSNYQFRQTFEWLNIISANKIISLDLGFTKVTKIMKSLVLDMQCKIISLD